MLLAGLWNTVMTLNRCEGWGWMEGGKLGFFSWEFFSLGVRSIPSPYRQTSAFWVAYHKAAETACRVFPTTLRWVLQELHRWNLIVHSKMMVGGYTQGHDAAQQAGRSGFCSQH